MPLDFSSQAFLARAATLGMPPLWELSVEEARNFSAGGVNMRPRGPEMDSVREQEITCRDGAKINAIILQPSANVNSITVFYHGGGWVLGSVEESDAICRHLAKRLNSTVVVVDYRLAPEHPFPTPLYDAHDAFNWVAENMLEQQGKSLPLILAGDSAGGNLATVTAQLAKTSDGPKPTLQILVYPVTDASMNYPSYDDPANQTFLPAPFMEWFWNHYTPNSEDRKSPLASPLLAEDLRGLPPAIVLTAESDILTDEVNAYAKKLEEAGVEVVTQHFEGQLHNFFALPGVMPAALKAVEYIGEQVDRHFAKRQTVDAVVVGAGFAGMYQLYRLREMGLSTRVIESGGDVGGTWYWNLYPGARCDVPSVYYSYSFSEELQQEWEWTEKYAAQPEILAYAQHVADRFDLRRDITFNVNMNRAVYDEERKVWVLHLDNGEAIEAKYFIMATGALSVPKDPGLKGLNLFKGKVLSTAKWPHEPQNLSGLKVGVIGTGSSGIQVITALAPDVEHLTVFQRTPSYSAPTYNKPMPKEEFDAFKRTYSDYRRRQKRTTGHTVNFETKPYSALLDSPEERNEWFEEAWSKGLLTQLIESYVDLMTNPDANSLVTDFVRKKIKDKVNDPQMAAALTPTYPFWGRRACLDTGYYETYNRDNVTLVDCLKTPIEEVSPDGIRTKDSEIELDVIVIATGFDASTGAVLAVDIRGRNGMTMHEKWASGVESYFGLSSANFPNMFTISGPTSPSFLSNMIGTTEVHVDWVSNLIEWMRKNDITSIEPKPKAEQEWLEHVREVGNTTVFSYGNSWYTGANVKGKPQTLMAYAGGCDVYADLLDLEKKAEYKGFDKS